MKFTCNLCGETTVKRVNPHAWANGTVFAECSGCHVKHKLIGVTARYLPGSAMHACLPQPHAAVFNQKCAVLCMQSSYGILK